MSEEPKSPPPQPPDGQKPPNAEPPAATGSTASAAPPPSAPKPETPPTEKPAAAAASTPPKPAAPAKPAGPVPQPWDSPLVAKLTRQFGSGLSALSYLGQNYLTVDRSLIPNVLQILRDEEQFDYCVDVTAVHYPKRELQFDVIWILYSFTKNERLRVKTQIADGAHIPSVAISGPPPTGWSGKRLTCSVFNLTDIRN